MNTVFWIRTGSVLMLLAVALGAFAAHALKDSLSPEMKAVFETGARYHAYHALAVLAAAWVGSLGSGRLAAAAAACFTIGIVLFSGSLYALSVTGWRKFGLITPLGGLLFLAGWGLLILAPTRQSP